MMEMEPELAEYVALKILADLRSGNLPPSKVCSAMTTHQLVDVLRGELSHRDLPRLHALAVKAADDAKFALCVHVIQFVVIETRQRAIRAKLLQSLIRLWQQKRKARHRIALMYAMTDFEDLPLQIHRRLFRFVLSHWNTNMQNMRDFSGGASNVISVLTKRLADTRRPSSKRWLYLLMACASDDSKAAHRLILKHQDKSCTLIPEAIAAAAKHLKSK